MPPFIVEQVFRIAATLAYHSYLCREEGEGSSKADTVSFTMEASRPGGKARISLAEWFLLKLKGP